MSGKFPAKPQSGKRTQPPAQAAGRVGEETKP
jgi:hypothetical protein